MLDVEGGEEGGEGREEGGEGGEGRVLGMKRREERVGEEGFREIEEI